MAERGRPKSEDPKTKFQNVRFTEAEFARLLKYAELNNMSVAKVIRESLNSIIEKEEK